MNRTLALLSVLLLFIIAPAMQAPAQNTEAPLTLQAAISAGEVRATFSGTGRHSGDSVLLTVEKTATALRAGLELTIPTGSFLRSRSVNHQNMVIAGIRGRYLGPNNVVPATKILLSEAGPIKYLLAAFCANAEKGTPSEDTRFILENPDPTLTCILSEVKDLSTQVVQAAVWAYTNGMDSIRNQLIPQELAAAEGAAARCGGHRLSRPGSQTPVLLLHGLWGGAGSWEGYADHLRENGWTEGPILQFGVNSVAPDPIPVVRESGNSLTGSTIIMSPPERLPRQSFVRVVFQNSAGQSFELQGRQVAAAIADIRRRTGSESVILIGHSMGGLAARAYLQSVQYQNDVAAVATVATPHMGSLLPYMRYNVEFCGCPKLIEWLADKFLDASAVFALAPDSAEMVALNTSATPFGRIPQEVQWLNIVAEYASDNPEEKQKLALFQRDLTRFFDPRNAASLASGAVLAQWTDGIVPVWSQVLSGTPVGASASVETAIVPGFHTDVTDSRQAWTQLDRFLRIQDRGRPAPMTVIVQR
jgi:pimeloyl-ACP methyl ester carboxylesterase